LAEKETRLGKGLGALLGEYLEEEGQGAPERTLPVDRIRPNPFQPRSDFDGEALEGLVESIRANGLLQPLVVRPAGDGWELVAGERRWRAIRELGWETAPAIVRELADRQMLVLALVENLQRENLSPIEEALGYRQLLEDFDLTQAEVAEQVGRDRSTVSNTLRLLSLDEEVRRLVASGALSAGHGRAILGLEEAEARLALAREAVEEGLSVREVERRVRRAREGGGEGKDGSPGPEAGTDPDARGDGASAALVRRAQRSLERALGTQVRVVLRGAEDGEIRVVFHDSEEFERLYARMTGDEEELFDSG